MPFTFQRAQKMVAVFILMGFFLLLVVLILILKGDDVLAFKKRYITYFNDTYGISINTQIKYKGIVIGKVKSYQLLPSQKIEMKLIIFKKFLPLIREDSVLRLSANILGSSGLTLLINQNSTALMIKPGGIIYSSDMEEGQRIFSNIFQTKSSSDELTVKAKEVLDMIIQLQPLIYDTILNVKETTSSLNQIALGLKGEGNTKISNSVLVSLQNIEKLTSLLVSPETSIGSIVNDDKKIYTQLTNTLGNLNKITAESMYLPEELRRQFVLIRENLIQLKYVLQNFPLVPKNLQTEPTISISQGGR